MLVKRLLTVVPVLLLLFLAVSIFFVPDQDAIAKDESRLNRHILTLSGDPESMNPWLSASTTDSNIFTYIFESLLKSNGNFVHEYSLADRAAINEEVVIHLDPEVDAGRIAARLETELRDLHPKIFDRIELPATYRADAYHGWDHSGDWSKKRYFVDLSEDKKLGVYDVPEAERFMSPYRPDLGKPCGENYKIPRLVVHFRTDPNAKLADNEIPNAVVSDIIEELIGALEYSEDAIMSTNEGEEGKVLKPAFVGLPGFVSDFDIEVSSFKWYQNNYGAKASLPLLPALANKDGDGTDDEKAPAPEEKADSEASPEEKAEAKPEEPTKKPEFLITDYPALEELASWSRYIVANFESKYANLEKAPSKEAVAAWAKSASEICAKAVKDAEEAAKKTDDKAMTLAAFRAKAPKTRVEEFPVVKMHLRENVKWHDYGQTWQKGPLEGKEITETLDASDVAFSFAFGRDPDVNSKRSSYSKSIRQMRVHDSNNISFVYAGVYSPAMGDLASANIIPEHRFRRDVWVAEAKAKGRGPDEGESNYKYKQAYPASKLEFTKDPIGTGPMTLAHLNGKSLPRWKSGEKVVLKRFEGYWNPLDMPVYQYMDWYVFDPNMGQETTEVVFRSGGTDIYGVRSHQVDNFIEDREDYYLYQRPNLSYEYIAFNLDRPQFKEKAVRQALSMAIDVDNIIKYVAYDQALRVNQPAYPMLPFYNSDFIPDYTFLQGEHKGKSLKDVGMKYFPYNMEEAKALLDANGWVIKDGVRQKDGVKLDFKLSNGGNMSSARGKIATLAIEKWKELGCEVKPEELEWNVFLQERVFPRNYDTLVLGWSGGTGFDKRQLWHSKEIKMGGLNLVAYRNPEADKLMDAMLKTYDQKEQVQLSQAFNAIVGNDCPYIFLFSPLSNIAVPRSMYWAKPILKDGKPVLDANGRVTREKRSMVDAELMALKYGPRTMRIQFARADEKAFEMSDDERYLVGTPEEIWKNHPSKK